MCPVGSCHGRTNRIFGQSFQWQNSVVVESAESVLYHDRITVNLIASSKVPNDVGFNNHCVSHWQTETLSIDMHKFTHLKMLSMYIYCKSFYMFYANVSKKLKFLT